MTTFQLISLYAIFALLSTLFICSLNKYIEYYNKYQSVSDILDETITELIYYKELFNKFKEENNAFKNQN